MKFGLIVAATTLALAAAPAMAGEGNPSGPAQNNIPTVTTGSFLFQGSNPPGLGGMPDPVTMPNASEAEPQPLNSEPVGANLQ